MKTNKKFLAFICAASLICQVGCSSSAKTDDSSSKADSTSSQSESEDTEKTELREQVENLAAALASYTGYDKESLLNGEVTISSEIHDIYDDTAVVNAYKSGDSSSLTDEKDQYILEEATKAIDEIITDGMDDYDKELAVYNYIFNNCHYDEGSFAAIDTGGDYSHTPYGFFHDQSVICVGYATTFQLFMDMLDIECCIIHSTESGEHAWNQVKINGNWYHLDVTFDNGTNEPTYDRFNVTDSIKNVDGYVWNTEDFHECTATEDNYWVKNAAECDDVYDIPEKLKEAADSGTEAIFLKFATPDDVQTSVYGTQIENIADSLYSESYFITSAGHIETDDQDIVLQISIVSYDDTNQSIDTDDETDSDLQKADIDYDKLSEDFYNTFSGDIELSENIEEYEDSTIKAYASTYDEDYITDYDTNAVG